MADSSMWTHGRGEAATRRDGASQRAADPRPDPLGGRGARPDGAIEVASERKPELAPKLARAFPGLRGPLKLAEAMAVLPLVRRRLPAARLPFEDARVIAAIGATLVATAALRRRFAHSALREGLVQALGVGARDGRPQRPRPGRLPRGRAQGDRRLRAGGRRPGRGAEGARPLRLEPGRADDAALGRRHRPARAAGRAARARSPAPGSASAAPRSRSRCSPGATATTAPRWPRPSTRPAARSSADLATKEPTPEQLEVGVAALAEILRVEGA